jgi:hypothetical protein
MTKQRRAKGPGVPAKIKGQGKYTVTQLKGDVDRILKLIPKGTFATAGAGIGGALGGPVGSKLGSALGSALSTISGYGSYKVKSNSVGTITQIGPEAENIPVFNHNEHGTRITHKEMFLDLKSPGNDFTSNTYEITPRNTDLFPWLSRMSQNYQKFKIHGMVFYYRSTSTDYNNSGVVAMAVQYDANASPFTSMPSLLNTMFSASAKPSISFLAPLECDPSIHPKGGYFLDTVVEANAKDQRFSSVGILNLATDGISLTAGSALGQLWVTYDIELLNPITPKPVDAGLYQQMTFNKLLTGAGTTEWQVSPVTSSKKMSLGFSAFMNQRNTLIAGEPTRLTWTARPDLVGKSFSVWYSCAPNTGLNVAVLDTFNISGYAGSGCNITGNVLSRSTYHERRQFTLTITEETGVCFVQTQYFLDNQEDCYQSITVRGPVDDFFPAD